jgi:hypothetical protein
MKKCCRCEVEKPLSEFGKNKHAKNGLTHDCRECHNATRRAWSKNNRKSSNDTLKRYHAANPDYVLWVGAKGRARKDGRPFSIVRTDVTIPEFCPALGIRLEKGKGKVCDTSPSLDCIVPELGYVPGNIAVMSFRANTIKQNATADELESVALWMRAQK